MVDIRMGWSGSSRGLARAVIAGCVLASAASVAVSAPCEHRLRAAFTSSVNGACYGALHGPTSAQRVRLPFAGPVARKFAAAPRGLSSEGGQSEHEGEMESAARLDPRFYDLFDRSQSKVDMIEKTEAMAPTGFEIDGAVLLNQRGERVDPDSLRDTSVGELASCSQKF